MAQRLIQAYHQAPWRLQVQRLRTFLLVILAAILVAGMYLYISGQAAMAGLDIQDNEYERRRLLREIASLKTELGNLTSVAALEERALKAGYKPVALDKGMYVIVPGYTGRPSVSFAPPPDPNSIPEAKLKPEYTQSLWEWLFQVAGGIQIGSGEK